ncbi:MULTISPECIES: RagB/SusD family nutrient uptake outer membrane protein [Butyricimonas]|uniref:RagB/SusD family nutrient uptake outer membrane protein n=1 Tax=Butyricimonas TaxID=574697 RepID=UPI001D068782|nr:MULTISPECIES: RagB/SusD family nutrient uptake outer membrane protein [Butyricimonas]MCB6973931.1 RagB/SusD family nutrient uptake outer membrane protein [Butyricimonas synergistica]MCG4520726.1 RagB/SusD family nutrient uptake outer membrane protein [Butyricimonas sp. DFI.6.44]
MKIKIWYIGIVTCMMFMTTACNDWLETTSETQVEASDLLNSEDGFKDAIIGVYINMGSEDAYGKNYTWFANDLAGSPYKIQGTLAEYEVWQKHRYSTVRGYATFKKMWARSYNVIANVNEILTYLEKNGSKLDSRVYNLMKGEMLGIRAFVHFDLLRMFGLPDWVANADKYTVPYVTAFTKEQTPQRTYKATAELLFEDIKNALACLEKDPARKEVSESDYEDINLDGFWDDRGKRMNYYAVEALAARVCMWEGSDERLEEALGYAQDVIDHSFAEWIDLEAFLATSVNDYRDWTFSTEHLFSLEVMGLTDLTQGYLLVTSTDYQGIKLSEDAVLEVLFKLYEGSEILPSANDVRYNTLLVPVDGGAAYNCRKLYQSDNYNRNYRNRIPMMKISEMYYIAAEYYINKGLNDKALSMLDIVREHRGVIETYDPLTADAREELTLEYIREFMSEGQTFYYWKRTGIACPVTEFEISPEDLIYLYPQEEVSEGGRHQDL